MKNESIEKIIEELDKTKQFVVKFLDTGAISDIERDIVLSKLRSMYEFIKDIKDVEVDITVSKNKPIISDDIAEVSATNESESITVEFDDVPLKEIIAKDEVNTMIQSEEVAISIEKEEVIQVQTKIRPNPNPIGKKEILAEKFQSQSFLNEALSQFQNVQDLSKKLQNQPLKDIFSAINLNDKFLFIKELFTNDSALYQSTIEKLNNAGNFNDAVRYLDGNFLWDFNDPMVQRFLELVRRRFM